MADMDDPSIMESGFDFDVKGKFLKGTDGYELGEQLDFHDLDGKEHSRPVPRIIGKTNPKAEVLTEGHPSNNSRLTIEQKVQKQLAVLTNIMALDSFG